MPCPRAVLTFILVASLTASCQTSSPPEGSPGVEPVSPAGPPAGPPAQPGWSVVGGGPARNGQTTDPGPATAPGVLWSTPIAGVATCDVVRARAVDRELLIVAAASQVFALDATDGRVAWMHVVSGVVGASPLVVGEMLFVPTLDGLGYFLSLADGAERAVEEWDFPIGGPPLIAAGRIIFEETSYSSRDPLSGLHAWDVAAKSEAWRQLFPGGRAGLLAADDDRIYVATESALRAWSVADGEPAWAHEYSPQVRIAGPVLQGDLALIVRGNSYDYTAEALERKTGALRWSVKLSGNVGMPPAATEDELLIGYTGGRLARLALADGTVRGETKLASTAEVQPVIAPDRVYYGRRKAVGAVRRADWETIPWEVELDGGVSSMLPLGDSLIVVTDDGFVHALGAAR